MSGEFPPARDRVHQLPNAGLPANCLSFAFMVTIKQELRLV